MLLCIGAVECCINAESPTVEPDEERAEQQDNRDAGGGREFLRVLEELAFACRLRRADQRTRDPGAESTAVIRVVEALDRLPRVTAGLGTGVIMYHHLVRGAEYRTFRKNESFSFSSYRTQVIESPAARALDCHYE